MGKESPLRCHSRSGRSRRSTCTILPREHRALETSTSGMRGPDRISRGTSILILTVSKELGNTYNLHKKKTRAREPARSAKCRQSRPGRRGGESSASRTARRSSGRRVARASGMGVAPGRDSRKRTPSVKGTLARTQAAHSSQTSAS